MTTPLLILDLDETLIYASEQGLARPPDFRVGNYRVYQRPGLTEFRDYCFTEFEVAVWTSADHSYATEVVSHLFGTPQRLRFVWTAERCTQRTNFETHERYAVKDLRKVRRLGIAKARPSTELLP